MNVISKQSLIVLLCVTSLFIGVVLQADIGISDDEITSGGHHPANYKRPKVKNATAYERIRFLSRARTWERIDIYVPQRIEEESESNLPRKFPCVILFYGGGWGGKVGGFKGAIQPLLDEGYVVAIPDYVLGASQPIPLAMWDGAAAIRFLRKHAAKYQIDEERMGAWGFSAGGWMIQHLCFSDSGTLASIPEKKLDPYGFSTNAPLLFQMIDSRANDVDIPIRLQAVATDWGAGRISKLVPDNLEDRIKSGKSKRESVEHYLRPWITPDDPPLFTCHNGMPDQYPRAIQLLQQVGVPCESAFLDIKNTHVPSFSTPATNKDGTATNWLQRNIEFFNEYLKNPKQATSAEFFPHGIPIDRPTKVIMRTVHPEGKIHYTLDGSNPTSSSMQYKRPIEVKPGTTLKAIVWKAGLKPSRITTAKYDAVSRAAPHLHRSRIELEVKSGVPFKFRILTKPYPNAKWYIAGKLIGKVPGAYRGGVGEQTTKYFPFWLEIDHKTGTLSGIPTQSGTNLFLITVNAETPEGRTLVDTISATITVTE